MTGQKAVKKQVERQDEWGDFSLQAPGTPPPAGIFTRKLLNIPGREASEMKSFSESVEEFLDDAKSWLTPADHPATVSLQHMAQALDRELSPALLSQYGLTYRSLLKGKPGQDGEPDDPLDGIIPPEF